ncbi:MFS transporter [Paenibacillus solisilvae]|uniref:MFS transporter n=1 Tax=Paenibacillus solisilvae TaxID=2486751 RepID=A0ABW0VTP7_9BACL
MAAAALQDQSQPPTLLEKPEKLWTNSFISLTLSYFLLFLSLQMLLSPFPSYVKDQFDPGAFTLSLLTSLFALSAIVARFATAALMRRFQRRTLLFTGLGIAAITTACYPFANSVGILLLLKACFGIGFGMSSTVLPTLVSQIIPKRRLGEGIGYFGLSTSLAMSIGPAIGLSVLGSYGFPLLTLLGTAAAAIIIPLLLISRSMPQQPVKVAEKMHASSTAAQSRPFNKRVLFPALLNALFSVTYGGLLSFIALFGGEVHLKNIGIFFLFNAVTVLIIRPISGRLFDSKGHIVLLIPGALFIIGSLLVLSYTASMSMLIGSALLYGLGLGVIQPTTQAWMLRESAPEHHGFTNSLFYNSTDFGVAVGAMLLGTIASATSYAVMYRWTAGFMVLFVIVYIGLLAIKPRKIRVNTAANAS